MSSRLPLALLSFSALGACATSAIPPTNIGPAPTRADSHVIEVTQASARLEIDVSPQDTMLTDKARSDLHDFAAAYLRYGHGALDPEHALGQRQCRRGVHACGANAHVAG